MSNTNFPSRIQTLAHIEPYLVAVAKVCSVPYLPYVHAVHRTINPRIAPMTLSNVNKAGASTRVLLVSPCHVSISISGDPEPMNSTVTHTITVHLDNRGWCTVNTNRSHQKNQCVFKTVTFEKVSNIKYTGTFVASVSNQLCLPLTTVGTARILCTRHHLHPHFMLKQYVS